MEIADRIKTAIGYVNLQEEGIIRYDIDSPDDLTKKNVEEFEAAVIKIGDGRAFCNLVIMKNFIRVEEDARQYAASEEGNKYTIADAFVVDSFALKLVVNFYIQFNKPVRPTRLFNSENEALIWLRTFL